MKPFALAALFAWLLFIASCGPKDPLGGGCQKEDVIGHWLFDSGGVSYFEGDGNYLEDETVLHINWNDGSTYETTSVVKMGTWSMDGCAIRIYRDSLKFTTRWDIIYLSADSMCVSAGAVEAGCRRVQ